MARGAERTTADGAKHATSVGLACDELGRRVLAIAGGGSLKEASGAIVLGCADDGKHAGSFSFACEEFICGACRLQEGGV